MAQNTYESALTKLQGTVPEGFTAIYAEVRGDALNALERTDEARAAYQLAIDKLPDDQGARRPLLKMKLDDLKAPADAVVKAEEQS